MRKFIGGAGLVLLAAALVGIGAVVVKPKIVNLADTMVRQPIIDLSSAVNRAVAAQNDTKSQVAELQRGVMALQKPAVVSPPVASPVVPANDSWTLVTDNAPWPARDGAFVASFRGYIWLANGYTVPAMTTNPIYRSKDGKTWEIAVPNAPWATRHLGNFVVFKDRLWMLGGDFSTDVWSSEDGINWTEETAAAEWGKRYNPYIGVFDGRMWVMGGEDETMTKGFRDVWSSDDGKTWTKVLDRAPWLPRSLISGFAVKDGAMWLIAGGLKTTIPGSNPPRGETLVEYNDVWKSTDGKIWTLVTPRANFPARSHVSVIGYNGHIIVTDGSQGNQWNVTNDAWYSDDGKDWKPLGGGIDQPWPGRHASSLVVHNGSLFLIAGYLHNDVWRLNDIATN